jgi:ubiquinone/menaquinone biosynthesis C-methylase UbiE
MSIDPKIFDKNYYFNICLGSEEFKNSGGRKLHPNVERMIDSLQLTKNMDVLEIGCGRGDTSLYVAKKVHSVVGIDYSPEAIKIAKNIRKKFPVTMQKKSDFEIMDATQLSFADNSFDYVILIDVINHLDPNEVEKMLKEISRVLKKGGKLFIRTCTNPLLLTKTYPYYILPMNKFMTWIDKKIKKTDYDSLPENPRTAEQELQHINEATYFTLKKLFSKYHFTGTIDSEVGFLKEIRGLRSNIYNFFVTLYPLSKYYPLSILFAGSFICVLKNNKS